MAGISPSPESRHETMVCYIPDGPQYEPFKYNPVLNAGPVYTKDFQGPCYEEGGVTVSNDFSVFMGVSPTTKAAECLASNNPDAVSLKWAENVEKELKGKLLGGDVSKWSEETQTVNGTQMKVNVSSFNVPQGDLPEKYCGDLKNWEYGPTYKPLFLDFSEGINGEVGMITVGNNKDGGIPDISSSNWNDNVQVVWDKELGKYVCQLDTYMIYKKVDFFRKAWTIKNTGGLITTHMYASGRYEVRAKVPQASGMVWAMWTFWGNEINSHQPSYASVHPSSSPMWSTDHGDIITEYHKQYPNHEIDIEIPSNAPQTISKETNNSNKYDTMNMNCYRWTNSNGTGAYNNLFCHNKKGPFIGDGRYHTYRFDWHTGGKDLSPRVDFYFDDNYIGTNDAFVPYMAGRLWIMLLSPRNGQPGGSGVWNGVIDQNFHPASKVGDVARYASVMVDYVRVTPFNEPNDHYAPSAFDQPCMGSGPGLVDCGRHNPDSRFCTKTSILPYTTTREYGCGGIKWIRKQ